MTTRRYGVQSVVSTLRNSTEIFSIMDDSKSVITTPPTALSPTVSISTTLRDDCPPGLEHLASIDGLYVHQLIEELEIFLGVETNNRYEIMDSYGRRIFFAAETSDVCVTACIGTHRPFVIQLLNFFGAPILTMSRDCTCRVACGCGRCGGNRVNVTHISGEQLGYAVQVCGYCSPRFELRDGNGQLAFLIHGPNCGDCCKLCSMGPCCAANFKILLPDKVTEIGLIQKQVSLREMVSDANTFGVNFPLTLHPRLKALILTAVFVIDFGYFETSVNQGGLTHLY